MCSFVLGDWSSAVNRTALALTILNSVSCVSALLSISACVSKSAGKSAKTEETAKSKTAELPAAPDQPAVCPEGSSFFRNPRRCVTTGGFVLGPFPAELQEVCRSTFPAQAGTCVQQQDWPAEIFMKLVSSFSGGCPSGTTQMSGGTCSSSGLVYGPFTLQQVVDCRTKLAQSDASPCDSLAWPVELFNRIALEPEKRKIYIVDETPSDSQAVSPDRPQTPSAQQKESGNGARETSAERSQDASVAVVKEEKKQTAADDKTDKKDSRQLIVVPVDEAAARGQGETSADAARSQEQQQVFVKAPTYCIYSWQELPGTADFSTLNSKFSSLRLPSNYPLDRPENDALSGSREFHNLDVCGRARFLKRCFQKVILDSESVSAQVFRAWALGRVRPVEAHMAFVMKESRLGLWPDRCWKGNCAGIGFAKVKDAATAAGRKIAAQDTVWRGLAHNILTNLEYSLREIAEKTKEGAVDLYSLAYTFAGKSRTRDRYALDVDKYYRELVACQIDDR